MKEQNLTSVSAIFNGGELITTIEKNKSEEIRILFLKNNMVDLRTYFLFPGESAHKPTKKGVWLTIESIPEVVKAIKKLIENNQVDEELILKESQREQLKVYSSEYMGKKVFHIRKFYLVGDEFKPGKGIAFSPVIAEKIISGLEKVYKEKK